MAGEGREEERGGAPSLIFFPLSNIIKIEDKDKPV
jgi:hypothetical protein